MTNLIPALTDWTVAIVPAFTVDETGGTDAYLLQPATFAVDVAGTGYTAGTAAMVMADGNIVQCRLTVGTGGAITAIGPVDPATAFAGLHRGSTTADTTVHAIVQVGGASGTGHVATYSTADSPFLLDFGQVREFARGGSLNKPQWTISGVTVTEHDTAPGTPKTFKVNRYISDVLVPVNTAAALLAARKTAGSALTITNAIDTTQHWEFASAFTVTARYMYLTLDWDALAAGASMTLALRLNRV